jgi:hypothetical protein
MNSSGIICVVKAGFTLPVELQDKLLAECPHGFSYSVAGADNVLESGFFSNEKPEDIKKTLMEYVTKFKDKTLVLFFNRMEDPPELCQQPIPLLTSKAGTVLINAFTDGEFKKYDASQEFDPGTAFLMEYFGDAIARKYAECKNSLDNLFTELDREDYRKELWAHLEPRGCVLLHDIRGKTMTFNRKNSEIGQYDWGLVSNALDYKEEKPEEPEVEMPVMPEGLNFMQRRMWEKDNKEAIEAAKAAGAKPKEVVAKTPDSSKSSVEKHPEGATKVTLPTNLRGKLEGASVRPDDSLQNRLLKEWYKNTSLDGCPSNYKHIRPAIPFNRLKPESAIYKFLKEAGLLSAKGASKDIEPHDVGKTDHITPTPGLNPDQIAKAVSIHKKATYIVDTTQFQANEKDNPDFFERTKIPLNEFIRMDAKDKQALRELVGAAEMERSLIIELVKRDSSLLKTTPVETQTSDKKEEKEEVPFMERRRREAEAKRKTA